MSRDRLHAAAQAAAELSRPFGGLSPRRVAGLALVAVMMAVFALGPFWPPFMNTNDKALHVAAFGAFGWLAAGAFPDRSDRRWQVLVALGVLALGIEVAQAVLTASRTPSLADAGASFVGAAFGVALAAVRTPMWVSGLLLALAGIGIQRFYYEVWPPISDALHRLI
ncbi:MAG: hypothetical protein ACOYJ6_00660 [Caulobacterales bacterium]|jgi:VanZ family protein